MQLRFLCQKISTIFTTGARLTAAQVQPIDPFLTTAPVAGTPPCHAALYSTGHSAKKTARPAGSARVNARIRTASLADSRNFAVVECLICPVFSNRGVPWCDRAGATTGRRDARQRVDCGGLRPLCASRPVLRHPKTKHGQGCALYTIIVRNRSFLRRFSDCKFGQFLGVCFPGSE